MKLQNKKLTKLLATTLVVISTTASALPSGWSDNLPAWSATASSCTLDESSAGKSEFFLSQFRYLGSAISSVDFALVGLRKIPLFPVPITVRCNVTPIYKYVYHPSTGTGGFASDVVTPENANWNSLVVGYKDPDGISTKAQVSVSLRKVSRATQGETTIATFNSNTSNNVAANEDVKQFNHAFDFKNNEYYVEINLIRADTTVASPIAYSVRLTNGNVPPEPPK